MRIAICDDEKMFREQLRCELEKYYHSLDVCIECFGNGEALLADYKKKEYDVVFLDIEMEGMDGLQVAAQLHSMNRDLPIVMVTTHTELAVEGYEVQAFRFLTKPIDRTKLYSALQAIEAILFEDEKICITSDGISRYLSHKSICYIKSENVYLWIVTTDGKYLIRQKLKEQMKELPSHSFVQVHRSYVVNLRHVISFDGTTVYLADGTKIPVSKANKEAFTTRMLHYMKGNK